MNRLFKLICLTLMLVIVSNRVFAADSIDSVIKKSPINETSTISVSVKNAKTGKVLYEYNQNKLMNPASALKVFTLKPAYELLGSDYTFKTQLYKDEENNVYIKLAGDPSLTTGALTELIKKNKGAIKDVIIDPYATDYLEWGIGWMWDDDTNPYLPKFSQYTINENKITLEITPGVDGKQPQVRNRSNYQTVLINMLSNGDKNDIRLMRQPWRSGDITVIQGSVKTLTNVVLPVDSTEKYFLTCLKDAGMSARMKPMGTVKIAPVAQNAKLIGEISSRPLGEMIGDTLKSSNNLYTELIFKAAGGQYTKSPGTTGGAIKMFKKYYSGIKAQEPAIFDASGASRNDLVSTDWMSESLNKFYKEENFTEFKVLLAKPIEGTLSDRLLNVSQHLRAKTGSISGVSSITGYITAKSGITYSFAIITQNFTQPSSEIKALEDKIINAIYSN